MNRYSWGYESLTATVSQETVGGLWSYGHASAGRDSAEDSFHAPVYQRTTQSARGDNRTNIRSGKKS